jgi:hypothetical protein
MACGIFERTKCASSIAEGPSDDMCLDRSDARWKCARAHRPYARRGRTKLACAMRSRWTLLLAAKPVESRFLTAACKVWRGAAVLYHSGAAVRSHFPSIAWSFRSRSLPFVVTVVCLHSCCTVAGSCGCASGGAVLAGWERHGSLSDSTSNL